MKSRADDTSPTTVATKPGRRWFQYRLRTLLVLTALVGVGLGCWLRYVRPFRVQAAAAEKLRAIGARIETRPAAPAWLCRLAGEEHFLDVVAVDLEHGSFKPDDLAPLADLTRLERLYLAASSVDDEGLSHVRGLRRLRRMSLWKTNVTDEGLRCLSGLKAITVLDVHRCRQITEKMLPHLRGMTKLKRLIFDFPVTDKGIEGLAALPSLRVESLTCSDVSDRGLQTLSRFSTCRSLRITSSQVSDAGVRHLTALASLNDLDLNCTQVTDAGIACLTGLPRLTALALTGTLATDAALESLGRIPRLRSLRLSGDRLTFGGVARSFGGRIEFAGLAEEAANLRGPQFTVHHRGTITDADLAHLGEIPRLTRLGVGGKRLTSAGLVHIKGLSRLEELGLSIPLTDDGLACLGGLANLRVLGIRGKHTATPAAWDHLRRLRNLEELSLGGSGMTDDRLAFLEDLANLRSLGLGANPITGSGLVHVRGPTKLEEIMLVDCTRFTNDGLVHLKGLRGTRSIIVVATLARAWNGSGNHGLATVATGMDATVVSRTMLSSLRRLSVQFTQVDDTGLGHLYDLPKLRDVTMLGSKVTRGGRVKLSRALGLDGVLY